jgi:hypothetical protein
LRDALVGLTGLGEKPAEVSAENPNLTPELYFSPEHVATAIEPEIRKIGGIEDPTLNVTEEKGASVLTVSFKKNGQPFTCRVVCKKDKDGMNYNVRMEFRNEKEVMFYGKGPGLRDYQQIQFALSHAFTEAFMHYPFPGK